MSRLDVFVTAVMPLRNAAGYLEPVVERTLALLEAQYTDYEVVLVDDCSSDATSEVIDGILRRLRCARSFRLSRPSGIEVAITAGLDSAIGDYVVVLDPRLDPPEVVPQPVEMAAEGGLDVVTGVVERARGGLLYRLLRGVFFRGVRRVLRVPLNPRATELRLFSRQAVNALISNRQRRRYFATLAIDIGYATGEFRYQQAAVDGKGFDKQVLPALGRATSLVVTNSTAPLRLASALGLVGSLLSFVYAVYAVAVWVLREGRTAEGWMTTALTTSVLFGLLFVVLALLGEYMGRLIDETTNRPIYHVGDESKSSVMLSDLQRRNVLSSTTGSADSQDGGGS